MDEHLLEEISAHDELCNKALNQIKKSPATLEWLAENLSNFVVSAIDELLAGDFIEKANGNVYYSTPEGDKLIVDYPHYALYKKANLIEYEDLKFRNEIIELLKTRPYSNVDILPLVKKYTVCHNKFKALEIRGKIRDIIEQFSRSGYIEDTYSTDRQLILHLTSLSGGNLFFNSMNIRSTDKFEDKYMKETAKPLAPIHVTVGGDAKGLIIGHNPTIENFVPIITDNKEGENSTEQLEYNNKILGLTKRQLFWTILIGIALIGLGILALKH